MPITDYFVLVFTVATGLCLCCCMQYADAVMSWDDCRRK